MWRVILGRDIERNLSSSKWVTMDNFSILVKGWWKMAISYFKHSYLNWRAILYRKPMIYVYAAFSTHVFLNLAFLIFVWTQSNFSSAWHDNQFFFLFFFRSHDLSTLGNDAYHRWPFNLKHHSSCENCFENESSFGSRVVHIISVQRKGMAQKCFIYVRKEKGYGSKGFRKMGNFRSTCPQGINQGDFRVSGFWDLYFWSFKGFGRFEAIASLDAYQITKYQTLQKLIIFLLSDFRRIREKEFLNQEFYG